MTLRYSVQVRESDLFEEMASYDDVTKAKWMASFLAIEGRYLEVIVQDLEQGCRVIGAMRNPDGSLRVMFDGEDGYV